MIQLRCCKVSNYCSAVVKMQFFKTVTFWLLITIYVSVVFTTYIHHILIQLHTLLNTQINVYNTYTFIDNIIIDYYLIN